MGARVILPRVTPIRRPGSAVRPQGMKKPPPDRVGVIRLAVEFQEGQH